MESSGRAVFKTVPGFAFRATFEGDIEGFRPVKVLVATTVYCSVSLKKACSETFTSSNYRNVIMLFMFSPIVNKKKEMSLTLLFSFLDYLHSILITEKNSDTVTFDCTL